MGYWIDGRRDGRSAAVDAAVAVADNWAVDGWAAEGLAADAVVVACCAFGFAAVGRLPPA